MKEEPTFLQQIKGDTIIVDTTGTESPALPGKYGREFLPEQDSAYYRALRLRIPTSSMLQMRINSIGFGYVENDGHRDTEWDIANRNLTLPAEYYLPKATDIVMQQVNIEQSFNVPFIKTYGQNTMQIPLSTIGTFLGISEDISPVIKYQIDFGAEVEVVVYSVQAKVVATMFKGKQNPGSYTMTWNGRDDKGRKMPSGDYIAEVRIGEIKFVRKRIVIP